jgi:hypothetical protein
MLRITVMMISVVSSNQWGAVQPHLANYWLGQLRPREGGPDLLKLTDYFLGQGLQDSAQLGLEIGCVTCKAALAPIDGLLENGLFQEAAEAVATKVCELLKIEGGDP